MNSSNPTSEHPWPGDRDDDFEAHRPESDIEGQQPLESAGAAVAELDAPKKRGGGSKKAPPLPTPPPAPPPAGEVKDADEAFKLIPLDAIDVDVPNHRSELNKEELQQLADNIKANGLQSPIRVYEKDGGRFILGFGFRRLAAHKLLKETYILANVKPAATVADIRLAQAIENIQRKDLTPLEEMMAVQVVVESVGGDVPKAAAMLGASTTWVNRRLALNRLSPIVQQMLIDGRLYIRHGEILARLADHKTQEEIAEELGGTLITKGGKVIERTSPLDEAEFKYLVERELQNLETVPWRLDKEFAGKVACSQCPSNSANAPGLFDDESKKAGPAKCTNIACFNEKKKAAAKEVNRGAKFLVEMRISAKDAPAELQNQYIQTVKPEAVIEAAKKLKAPKEAKSANRRSVGQTSRYDYELQNAGNEQVRSACRKWMSEHGKVVEAALKKDRMAMCVLEIARGSVDSWQLRNYPAAYKKKLVPFIQAIGRKLDDKAIVKILLDSINQNELLGEGYFMSESLMRPLCKRLKVQYTPWPDEKAIKAEARTKLLENRKAAAAQKEKKPAATSAKNGKETMKAVKPDELVKLSSLRKKRNTKKRKPSRQPTARKGSKKKAKKKGGGR